MQQSYVYTAEAFPNKETETERLKRENEELKSELESMREDSMFYRDLIAANYSSYSQAHQNMRMLGRLKQSRFYLGHAVAFRTALETFNELKKLR